MLVLTCANKKHKCGCSSNDFLTQPTIISSTFNGIGYLNYVFTIIEGGLDVVVVNFKCVCL